MGSYWFRKRRGLASRDLGWGWVPISWEGWLLTLGFVAVLYYATTIAEGWSLGLMFLVIVGVFAFVADLKTQNKVIFK